MSAGASRSRNGGPDRAAADGASGWDPSLEAIAAAPDSHRVLFENDRVRVVEVLLHPGQSEPMHVHPLPAILTHLASAELLYQHFDEGEDGGWMRRGEPEIRPVKTGYTRWLDPEPPHAVTNHSDRISWAIRVELK